MCAKNMTYNPILLDKRFVSWCAGYLREVFQERQLGHFNKCMHIKRRSLSHSIELNDFDWIGLRALVNASKHIGYVDCMANSFARFAPALLDIFNTIPVPIAKSEKKEKPDQPKKIILSTTVVDADNTNSDDMAFTSWANKYLKRLVKEVARKKNPEQNVYLLREFRDAAHEEGVLDAVSDLSRFAGFPDKATRIDCKQFQIFKKPLRRIYNENKNKANNLNIIRFNSKKDDLVKPKIIIPDKRYHKKFKKVGVLENEINEFTDLAAIPAETLHVTIHPIALPGRLDDPAFKDVVARALLYALKNRNTKWLSGLVLSSWFQVDRRSFEDWAKDHFDVRVGKSDGKLFFSLKSLLPNQVSKTMSNEEQKPEGQNPTETEAKEQPALGTPEFDTLITQFLSADAIWRNLDTMVEKLNYSKSDLVSYLDSSPSIARRASKTAGKVLYALFARCNEPLKTATEVAAAGSATSVATSTDTTTTTVEEKKKVNGVNKVEKPLISAKEILAFGMLHEINDSLIRVMNFYGNGLAVHHTEAFSQLSQAQKKLSDGVSLLKNGTKINDKLLPELEAL